MKLIRLTIKGVDILGSDGYMKIDGRFNLNTTIDAVLKRNKTLERNFPHKVCDGFYFCDQHFNRISKKIQL